MSEYSKKIFIIGDANTGKTSIIRTFCNEEAPLVNLPTTLDRHVTDVEVNGKKYKLDIWETVCSRHYRVNGRKVRQSIYKDTDLVIIVFDISRRNTLDNVTFKWIREVKYFCKKNTRVILVGNKKDCRNDGCLMFEKLIEYPEGLAVAQEIGADAYIESSAIRKEGIREIFVNGVKTFRGSSSCKIM